MGATTHFSQSPSQQTLGHDHRPSYTISEKERHIPTDAPHASPRTSLLLRVFLTNATVLAGAVLILAVSPVTVSRPISLGEAVVLVAGLTALLVLNLVLFRGAFAPLVRLSEAMHAADLLRPGHRVPIYGTDAEIAELTRAFNQMLDRLENERRQSARRALRAQEDERRRVAQELHDEVGQSLTSVVLQLEGIRHRAPDDLCPEITEAREAAREGLEDVREIAHRLRPEALDELGLQNALAALADRIFERGQLRVRTDLDGDLPDLDPEAELVIYRVAQEGLTNVLRHAAAHEALLSLRGGERRATLAVIDDGCGFGDAEAGAGIQGMRERALLVGGALSVRDRAGNGTELRLELPIVR
jgi:two-component system, NarL family, sensor histidine kinase UhpB